MNIIKRDGKEAKFDKRKIESAIRKANDSIATESLKITEKDIKNITDNITNYAKKVNRALNVEEIQDKIEDALLKLSPKLGKNFISYRYLKALQRKNNTTDARILSLVDCNNEDVIQENSNKNPTVCSVQRDYVAGEVSKDLTERLLLGCDQSGREIVQAHKDAVIHFHDADYYLQHMFNCCLVNLNDVLQNGTMISGVKIDRPHSFQTACNIATQIIAQVASNQYGGQSISIAHLAPFVDVSRKRYRDELSTELGKIKTTISKEDFESIVESRVRNEIKQGVQLLQYQVVTLQTTNGQAPFITFFMYLNEAKNKIEEHDLALVIEEILNQRIQGVKNAAGIYVTPAFPKLIYVLQENNIKEGTPYYYLTRLAAKCTAKRLVPDYISEKKMLELKISARGTHDVYTCMGCRSFLTPDRSPNGGFDNKSNALDYEPGKSKYYGRFNQGVVTINLPDVALTFKRDYKDDNTLDNFWKIFEYRLELCHRALRKRHERLLGTLSDSSPIHWQYGALARLNIGEKIDKLLYGGYSTISLGYAGLWETVYALIGKKLTEPEGKELGLEIMKFMNKFTAKWKKEEDIDYSLYGTPIELVTYKFAQGLQKRFGIVPGVTDKNYITNSYHVHVTEPIDAFEKLKLEAEFQALSPGGAISYIEVPNMQNNIEAVLSVMKFIYDTIIYAELNTKSDYCSACGFDGEIQIVQDADGKLDWRCPKCGCMDHRLLHVARRTCGYIGSQFWNQGRTQEIKERVLHL